MKPKIVLPGIFLLALPIIAGADQLTASLQLSLILVPCAFILLILSNKTAVTERKNLEITYALVCLLMSGLFSALAPYDGKMVLSSTQKLIYIVAGLSVSGFCGYQVFFAPPDKEETIVKQKGQPK